jgi:hypothetical protein
MSVLMMSRSLGSDSCDVFWLTIEVSYTGEIKSPSLLECPNITRRIQVITIQPACTECHGRA